MGYKIFHNPRCKHSRAGLDYLKTKTQDIDIRNYLEVPITKDELREILLKSNLKPSEIVRTKEEYFRNYLKDKSFSEDEWIIILTENPKLIQRPIIVGKYKAVVGNPISQIDKLVK